MRREKIKKIAGWRPSPELTAFGAAVMLVLLLVPLLRMTMYSVPWYDDYDYGGYAKGALREANTLASAFKGALESTRISWYAWQGTYASIMFMSLMPGIWGEEYYHWGPVFLILFLTAAVFLFMGTLTRKVLKADRAHTLYIQAITAAVVLVLIHTPQQGFYWYNAGVHYVGMHSFLLLMISVVVNLLYTEKRWACFLLALAGTLLAAVVAGANFVTTLQGLLVLLTLFVVGIVWRKRKALWMSAMLVVYALGFCQNVKAPGNVKRSWSYIGWGMPPVKAIVHSFMEAFHYFWRFSGWMFFASLLLLLPVVWHMVGKVKYSFRLPGLLSLWSLCLYATGFTPSLYSLGHAGLARTLVAVKITFQLLFIINLIYWCGWIRAFLEKRGKVFTGRMFRWWFYPLIAVLMLVIFYAEPNKIGSYSSYGAYYFVHTGEANNFYQEYLERVKLLKSDEESVVLKPYVWKPWYICIGDLSEDPNNETNHLVAAWYGKASVVCRQPEEETESR